MVFLWNSSTFKVIRSCPPFFESTVSVPKEMEKRFVYIPDFGNHSNRLTNEIYGLLNKCIPHSTQGYCLLQCLAQAQYHWHTQPLVMKYLVLRRGRNGACYSLLSQKFDTRNTIPYLKLASKPFKPQKKQSFCLFSTIVSDN